MQHEVLFYLPEREMDREYALLRIQVLCSVKEKVKRMNTIYMYKIRKVAYQKGIVSV